MPYSTRVEKAITSRRLPARRQSQLGQWWRVAFKNLLLVFLSILFLPIDSTVLLFSYGLAFVARSTSKRRQIRSSSSFYPKTVLVTGIGMSKGLCLARMFYEAGHDVIGADVEPSGVPVSGRTSRALKRSYRLSSPDPEAGAASYVHDLLAIVRREKVDLWVSCSGVASAIEDAQAKEVIERRTPCKAIQFLINLTDTLHAKHSFVQHTISLGLNVPDTHYVTSRAAVHKILNNAPEGKRYILKNVGVDDSSRGDLTLLPRPTLSETYQHVSGIDISPKNPWVLQVFIRGGEYCTHALIINGEVKAFVACPSSELLMHYEPLSSTSALSKAMLEFTQEYAGRTNDKMTGHLSFDFMVDERATANGVEMVVYPIECNPRAHTAVVLFNGRSQEMADAYLTALLPEINGLPNGHTNHHIITPEQSRKYYWSGHDVVTLLLQPLYQLLTRRISLDEMLQNLHVLLRHLLFWRDGTYELWDPLPWWWLYHVYWPGIFLAAIWQGKEWSRINVSTTKMFAVA